MSMTLCTIIFIKTKVSAQMQVAEKSFEEVKLTGSAKIRAGSYSGGMKRRLSVAIALIGDPKLVILDEPVSTLVYSFHTYISVLECTGLLYVQCFHMYIYHFSGSADYWNGSNYKEACVGHYREC